MSASSDEAIHTVAPLLEPLLSLVGDPSLKWSSTSTSDDYAVSEIPSAPALGIPLKCFRTQFVVDADVDSFARMVVDPSVAQQCDPTLSEIRILSEGSGGSVVLYTAYTSPSPWLISPRDFCVSSASVLTTPSQLNRVCPQVPFTVFPPSLEDSFAPTNNTVFIHNSRSTTHVSAPRATDGSTAHIRGIVHCYGYAAWADPQVGGRLHVTNFCCVDACGRVPKWLVAAAVDQNTQKLKRMSQLIAGAARQQQPKKPVNSTVAPTFVEHAADTQLRQPQLQDAPGFNARVNSGDNHQLNGPPSNASPAAILENLPKPRSTPPSPPSLHGEASSASAPLEVQTPRALISAPMGSLSVISRHFSASSTPVGTPVADASTYAQPLAPSRSVASTGSQQRLEAQRRPFLTMAEPVGQLTGAHGWCSLREVDGAEEAELCTLPTRMRTQGDFAVALRVRAAVKCSLDTVALILRSPARAPDIDPELVRLVAAPSSQLEHCRHPSAAGGSHMSPTVPCPFSDAADAAPTQLRHYEFSAESRFTFAWDTVLHCADGELSPHEGGELGFHTPGIPASTFVWVGRSRQSTTNENTDGGNGFDVCPHSRGVRRLHVRVFGVAAVAIPRSAATVRLTHYLLFQAPPAAASSRHEQRPHFTDKDSRRDATAFLCAVRSWMRRRMGRLRGLCEAQQLHLTKVAMAPLDTEPLLRYLLDIHRIEMSKAGRKGAVRRVGDVVVRLSHLHCRKESDGDGVDKSLSSPSGASATPPLFVYSLTFPCSLSHLLAYMKATAARSRHTLDRNVVLYRELPTPPGFRAIHIEVMDDDDRSSRPTSFTFLETFGLLRSHDTPSPMLVLSRVNCDRLKCMENSEEEEEGDISPHISCEGMYDEVRTGSLYCSGWVATALDKRNDMSCPPEVEQEAAKPSAVTACGDLVGVPGKGGRTMQQPVARVQQRMTDSPSNRGARNEAAEPQASSCSSSSIGIEVTQYSCLSAGLPRDCTASLSLPRVEREAMVLQRFRDAVCEWRSQ